MKLCSEHLINRYIISKISEYCLSAWTSRCSKSRSVQNLVAIENWGAKCYHSTGFGSWISRDPLDYHFQILQTSCHVHWKIVRLGKNLENHQIFCSWLWNILSTSSQSKFFEIIYVSFEIIMTSINSRALPRRWRVIIWNDFIYRYTVLGLICIHF